MPLDDTLRQRPPHEIVGRLRKRQGLTLIAAAAKMGLSKSELSRIESGQRRLTRRHIAVLAQLHGIDFRDLAAILLGDGGADPSPAPRSRPAPVVPTATTAVFHDLAAGLSPEAQVYSLVNDGHFAAGSSVIAEPTRVLRPGGCFLPHQGARRIYRLCIDDHGRAYGLSLCGQWTLESPLDDGVLRVTAILPA